MTARHLYSLQHVGYSIPPQGGASWIGEAGPGPSFGDLMDDGTRAGLNNDFTNRNTTFDLEPAAPGPDAEERRRLPRLREPAEGMGRGHAFRPREPRIPIMTTAMGQDSTLASLTRQWPLRGSDWRAGVVRLFEDGGEFRLLLVGGED